MTARSVTARSSRVYRRDGCLIGMGSTILDGARIGRGSLVGAGALVTPGTDIPPVASCWAPPARVVRPINQKSGSRSRDGAAHYVELARSTLQATADPRYVSSSV